MKKITILLVLILISNISKQKIFCQSKIKHFVFFSRDRELIHDSSFYSNLGITGAQITYVWKRLEPTENSYDFSEIEEDLVFLHSKGKKLFIQIQDVTFSPSRILVPNYILNDSTYHGGASPQYWENDDGEITIGGWVARRWDPLVANRYRKLLIKLAEQFDGRIEGINLPETALDVIDGNGSAPEGFTRRNYLKELKKNMTILKDNFKKSVPILYANFMPGDSKKDLKELYDYAVDIGHGVGGPDIKVYRKGQMENSYPLIRSVAGKIVTGAAVQEGNYCVYNPKTKRQVTVSEILDFARDYLKLNYIFWCIEEPYYSDQVLPLLETL
jgi:hypothetical protein